MGYFVWLRTPLLIGVVLNQTNMKRKSKIWEIGSEEFKELVCNSFSYADILRFFGYRCEGGFYKILHKRIAIENIDASHLKRGLDSNKGRRFGFKKPLSELLINGIELNTNNLKKRLFKENIKTEICEICGLGPSWNNKALTLQIDHIDGDKRNNTIDNLRIICPNCHSQTETFSGRNSKSKEETLCKKCAVAIHKKSTHCVKCSNQIGYHPKKLNVDVEELRDLLTKHSFVDIGKMFSVSDNTVRKRAIKYGLTSFE